MRPNQPRNRNGDADSNSQKLHKLLAQSGLGSRRGMEQLIEEGKVSVNGLPATVATRISPGDTVMVDGRRVNLRFGVSQPRVLLYHKPEGEIVSRDDPEGRPSVFDKLPAIHNGRWIAIGRLDINTSGLLLFTNHGELANSLMHPRFQLEREYAVRLLGRLNDDQMDALDIGVELEDGPARVHSIEDRGGDGANHWYHIVIKEGRNREVRRLFEALGLTVSRLIRVRFGTLEMPPYLKRGQQKELSADQVRDLMQWAGVRAGGGSAQGKQERRHGQSQPARERGDAQPRGSGSHASGFSAASGFGQAQPRRGRGVPGQAQGQGQARRGRGTGRPIGPMDMGDEAQQRRTAGGAGAGQGRGRDGRQRNGPGGAPRQPRRGGDSQQRFGREGGQRFNRGEPATGAPPDDNAGNRIAQGRTEGRTEEQRRPRRRRGRGGGQGGRVGPAQNRAPGQSNATLFEDGPPVITAATKKQHADSASMLDEFGDRNGNVATPEQTAPSGEGANRDPRSAAKRPNRRRRKPVTT